MYTGKDREVKSKTRDDKRKYLDAIADRVKEAAKKNQLSEHSQWRDNSTTRRKAGGVVSGPKMVTSLRSKIEVPRDVRNSKGP